MTLSQLKEDSKFLRLTDKQKTFVLVFCETNGDKVKAAHTAYDCKSDESALAMAYSALRNPVIKAIVTQFVEIVSNRYTKDELLDKLGSHLRNCKDDEAILKYAALISKLEGWEVKPASTPPGDPQSSDEEKIRQLEN